MSATIAPPRMRSATSGASATTASSKGAFNSLQQHTTPSSTSSSFANQSMPSSFAHPHSHSHLSSSSSSSAPHTSPIDQPSSIRDKSTRPHMVRTNSHLRRTGPGALVIPIPPTLANSPLLQSPNSIFRRPHVGPRASPGAEEERWLRDTVPIGAGADVLAAVGTCAGPGMGMAAGILGVGENRRVDARARAGSVSGVALGRHSLGVPPSPASGPPSVLVSPGRAAPPPTPALALPSSLPRSGTYTHAQAFPQRDRG